MVYSLTRTRSIRWCSVLLSIAIALLSSTAVVAQDAGQAKLDEATERKLTAQSPADLAKVIELCEQAIDLGLDDIGTQIAKTMLAASALQRAQNMLQNLPRVAGNPNALRNLSSAMRTDLDRAIANNPKLADAHIMLAQLETLPGGSRDRAIEHINTAIEALQDKPAEQADAYVLRAKLKTNHADRLADLNQALELDPNNADAWQAKIVLQLALGKVEEAAEDAESLLEQDDSNRFALQVAIETFTELKRYDDAHALLTRQIEKNPENGNLYRWRGRLGAIQNNSDEALADFNKALELNKRDAEALLFRGQVYLFTGETEKANRDVSDSLLIEPDSIQGLVMRSLISAREERFADAIKDMEVLVRHDPTNKGWIMQLAAYYQMDRRPRLAIKVLDELVSNDSKNWQALRSRGDAKLSISDHKEAIEDYRRAVRAIEINLANSPKPLQTGNEIEPAIEPASDASGEPPELPIEISPLDDVADAIDLDPLAEGLVPDLASEEWDEEDENEAFSGLYNNLAWLLSTSPDDSLRNGQEALELALKASKATYYKAAHILSTLAAAYAETGDFEKAREWAAKAVELGKAEGHEQIDQLEKELESYQQDKPWREEQTTEENAKPLAGVDAIDT